MADVDNYRVPDKAPEPPPSTALARYSTRIPDLTLDVGLPANVDAEKTILGAVLLDNEAFLEANEKIKPDDFSLDSHRRIFLRMAEIMDENRPVDIVTLSNELAKWKEVEAVGGVAYLASLTEGLPRRPVIDEYIRIVKDKSTLRRLMGLASHTIAKAADQSEDALGIATWHAGELQNIIEGGMDRGLKSAADLSVEVMDKFIKESSLTESPGFGFGISDLDDATGGIMPGEQCVVGAYSSVGKTTILAQVVAANCPKGHPMALFLYEPTRHSFMRRLWSIVADVRYIAVTRPWLATKEERDKLLWAEAQVMEWPLWINDLSSTDLEEQLAQTRIAMHRDGIELTAIDYIQRMAIRPKERGEDIRLRIGRASTENANIVKNTKNRTLILSQLRRGSLDAVPTIDQLRESGQLENDAATILLMHLKFDAEQGHFTNEGSGIVAKQRYGVPCNVKLLKDSRTALWITPPKNDPQRSFHNDDDEENAA